MKDAFFVALRFVGIKTHKSLRLSIRFIALVAGLYSVFRVATFIQKGHYDTAEFWHIGVIFTAIVEFVFADVFTDHAFPFDTERKLTLMEQRIGENAIRAISDRLAEMISEFHGCDKSLISATVHIVAELSATSDQRVRKGLLQLTDYVGPDGGKKGRVTLMTQGVIGRCARTAQVEIVGFADEKEYLDAMVKSFGFTAQEAARHTKAGRSYLAVPLVRDDIVIGVLYFFTSEPQVFPRAANLGLLRLAAKSIAELIGVIGLT